MADWIECKSSRHGGSTVFVNLDRVDCIIGARDGAEIVFTGGADDTLLVTESPQQLIGKNAVRRNA